MYLTGFILGRSIHDSDIHELPESVSKSTLHLSPFAFIIATGYVTLVLGVTNIGSDLLSASLSHLSAGLSHIDVWCLFLHFKPVLLLRHSTAPCFTPVQLKQSFLLRLVTVFAVYNPKIYGQVSHRTHINS